MFSTWKQKNAWAVVLAGGDGKRLRSVTEHLNGDARPKQFCNLFGDKTLLGHTKDRIAPIFVAENTLFALSRPHENYYREEMLQIPPQNRIVQPSNRGTAIAIALCLEEISLRDPEACVAFFPSDHHFTNASAFRSTVTSALAISQEYPHYITMLGAKAHYPEIEYGWIEPGRTLIDSPACLLRRVSRFWEKPSPEQSVGLRERGCLWNTFVMVGLVSSFLELLWQTVPELSRSVENGVRTGRLDLLYKSVAPVDFSSQVLAPNPQRLLVLHDEASGWTDLGNPQRLKDALARNVIYPSWLNEASLSGFRRH